MPSDNEEYPGQPVWQSVLIFCCKGMIEGIIVLLFMWLLFQVLFTKHLEVHLQVLLGVGLMFFCLSLILGCALCWQRTRLKNSESKEDGTPCPIPPAADQMMLISSSLPSEVTPSQILYEELEGEVLNYPSTFESSTPSDDDFATMPFASSTHAASELNDPKACIPLRRLSSPSLSSPLYRPMTSGRSSLPSFPKFGLLSKTQKVLKRHFSVSGTTYATEGDNIMLTTPSPVSSCSHSALQMQGLLVEKSSLPNYGSQFCHEYHEPFLHFNLTFSPTQHTLTIYLLRLTGTAHRLGAVTVHVSLPPICPDFLEMSNVDSSLKPELHGKSLLLQVNTLEDLCSSTLQMTVFTQDVFGAKASMLGKLEVHCGRLEWTSDRPIYCSRALRQTVAKVQS